MSVDTRPRPGVKEDGHGARGPRQRRIGSHVFLAILAILGIGHGFGLHVVEESPPYEACRGGSGPLCCWRPVRCSPAPGPR